MLSVYVSVRCIFWGTHFFVAMFNANFNFFPGEIDGWKSDFTVAQNEEFDQDYQERMKMCPDLAALIQFD